MKKTFPFIQEFSRNLGVLWNNMLTNGFWSTWSQLVDSLDPFGEKNALKGKTHKLSVALKINAEKQVKSPLDII